MKKLRLHRDVVRTLTSLTLANVHGGAVTAAINCNNTNNIACPSVACPTHRACSAIIAC